MNATAPYAHLLTQYPDRASWLEGRSAGEYPIGGSTVPKLLGVSNYGTLWDLWAEAHAPELVCDEPPNDAMARGNVAEAPALAWYCDAVDHHAVHHDNAVLTHPDHPWARYSPDGIRVRDGRLVEVKTTRDAWGWPESCTIDPLTDAFRRADWVWQTVWGCVVTDTDEADVAVCLLGHGVADVLDTLATRGLTEEMASAVIRAHAELRVYTITAPRSLRDKLLTRVSALRDRHLVGGEEPPMRPANAPEVDLDGRLKAEAFPIADDETWALVEAAKAARDEAKRLDGAAKAAGGFADEAADALMRALKSVPGVRCLDGRTVRWTRNRGAGNRKHLRFYGWAKPGDTEEGA